MEEKARKATAQGTRNPAPGSDASSSSKRCKLFDNLSDSEDEEDAATPPPVAVSDARVDEAFSYYWEAPRSSQSSDPFDFWRQNSHEYPEVFVIATSTFTCPSGSVDSERLFSVAGDVIRHRRTSLSPENAEDQIFLAKNLPYFDYKY